MAATQQKVVSQALGVGCLSLFALPFIGFGSFALYKSIAECARGRWGSGLGLLGFGLVFCAVGIAIMVGARVGARKARHAEAARAAHPDEPWLWRDDWARGEVKSGNKGRLLFSSMFALFWNAISFTVAIVVLPQASRKPITLLVLIFPLIGMGLLAWAWRNWVRQRKFGDSRLHLTTAPGVIGGALAGVIHTERPLRGPEEIRLRLVCLDRDSSGDSVNEKLQWEEEKVLTGEVIFGGGIPVMFNIPFECRPTETFSASHSIVWRLEASARVPGADYAAQFEVPVFKTSESRPDAPPLPDPAAAFEKPVELAPPSGVRIRTAPTGGTEFYFAAAPHKSAAAGLTAFTGIWIAAIVLMIKLKAPIGFPIVFGLFGVLMILGVLGMWTGASRIVADASGLSLTSWYCLVATRKFLPQAEVQGIEPKMGMSAGATVYYDLVATTTGGRKVKLASSVKGRKKSEWLAREIQNALRPR